MSNVHILGFEEETETLRVKFDAGVEWEYSPVNKDTFERFINSHNSSNEFFKVVRGIVGKRISDGIK